MNGLTLYIVMELCSRGDLSNVEKPLEEERCRKYFRGIFNGLRFLKKRGVVHRDLKPQNILISNNDEAKIADFTFSKQMEEQELMQTYCGTPLFMSPEVLSGEAYSDKCDLYSVGVMLYTYVYGQHPLGAVKTHLELMNKMRSPNITFPNRLVWEGYEKSEENGPYKGSSVLTRKIHEFSPELIHLLKGLLKQDPNERMTWDEIYEDKWIQLKSWEGQDMFVSPLHPKHGGDKETEKKLIHASSAPSLSLSSGVPLPLNGSLGAKKETAPPLVPRALKSVKTTGLISSKKVIGSATAFSIKDLKNVEEEKEPSFGVVKTARSRPRKIEPQTPPVTTQQTTNGLRSNSTSPANSGLDSSDPFHFKMSTESNNGDTKKYETKIILDYYGTPPQTTNEKTNATSNKEKEQDVPTIFSRSIDFVHKVFTL